MAEEDLNYVTVKFKSHNRPSDEVIYEDVRGSLETWGPHLNVQEKHSDFEEVYDDVWTKEKASGPRHICHDNLGKVSLHTSIKMASAGLGIICIILMSVIITLALHINDVVAERRQENANLTDENQQLFAQVSQLRGRVKELARERDSLNWTMGVILKYDSFPVKKHCSEKVLTLCEPCMQGWLWFRSKCYLFLDTPYYQGWKTWKGSVEACREMDADLVGIDSQEEQEFVTNHTKFYNDNRHGYWMGLRKDDNTDQWMWHHGGNLTVTFWRTQYYSRTNCALILPSDSLANWSKESCEMKNRYVCQTSALFKPDLE
ncbi:oxidized low-density lipoprotein receptor 1-like isoform X1 [Nerophis ophidion]|uniref:oxidized low-density lipoprotein receptor 1-like isoform X1 n=1 Tax=Nerophis ophidion TaxID=159077 RepID=UPI002ADF6548|nr:oxidized low-density lipoprotein receptor 1-like isoform X1 [Nerophis ophidion]